MSRRNGERERGGGRRERERERGPLSQVRVGIQGKMFIEMLSGLCTEHEVFSFMIYITSPFRLNNLQYNILLLRFFL